MTTTEFSNEFDVLYNSITSNQAPGLDDYEKSVFLTKAQLEVLTQYFNTKVDNTGGGFDGSQVRQYDFSKIINTEVLTVFTNPDIIKIDDRSRCYKFPDNYYLSVNETIVDSKKQYTVIPISYTEYQRLRVKPYAYPPKRIAWRLFNSSDGEMPVAEIIGKFEGDITYKLRYIRKPNPIILSALEDGLTIEGEKVKTECELPSQLHPTILELAVSYAKITYLNGSTSTLASQNNNNAQ